MGNLGTSLLPLDKNSERVERVAGPKSNCTPSTSNTPPPTSLPQLQMGLWDHRIYDETLMATALKTRLVALLYAPRLGRGVFLTLVKTIPFSPSQPKSAPRLCPARSLHIPIFDKTTLCCSTPCFSSTHGLKVTVPDETALTTTVAIGCPAVSTSIRV